MKKKKENQMKDKNNWNEKQTKYEEIKRTLVGHKTVVYIKTEVLFVLVLKLLHFISHFYKRLFRLEIHIINFY